MINVCTVLFGFQFDTVPRVTNYKLQAQTDMFSSILVMSELDAGFCYNVKCNDNQEGATGGTEYLAFWKCVGVVNRTFCVMHPVASYIQGRENKPVTLFLGEFAKLRKTTIKFVMSICTSVSSSTRNNCVATGRIVIESDIRTFLVKSVEKIQVSLKSDKNNKYFT